MLDSSLEKLLAIASQPLGPSFSHLPARMADLAGKHAADLASILHRKNGWLAFESALHLFPVGTDAQGHELEAWNQPAQWRESYGDAIPVRCLFFAQDIFGQQFCLIEEHICRFNPETARFTNVAATLEAWAAWVLSDYRVETGWPLAHAWQVQHGPLALTNRLVPITPFILGGAYAVDNLMAIEAVEAMWFRGSVYQQSRDLPDGTRVRVEVTE
jgi:hypothetical protein